MQAVILAGEPGTPLRPITVRKPTLAARRRFYGIEYLERLRDLEAFSA
jgi:hypothetical protein